MLTCTGQDRIGPTAAPRRSITAADGAEDQSRAVPYAELAERLATRGPAALQGELRRLIRDARRHGVTPLLVTILLDPDQSEVARQRAFGRILTELERPHESRLPSGHPANDAA